MRDRLDSEGPAGTGATPGIHRHEHEHGGERHRHPHHHAQRGHEHRHGTGFERLTYLVSPVHGLDPRAKILGALALVVAVALTPPLRVAEFALLIMLLLVTVAAARLPFGPILGRASLVLPFAAAIALFAPLSRGGGSLPSIEAASGGAWLAVWSVVTRAWLSALVVTVLAATTPTGRLIRGLEALRVPAVLLMLFSFVSRYVVLLRDQLHSMQVALASRSPALPRLRRFAVYGNLAGNLFVRAYDRGERIHAAMLSRGFDGTMPAAEPLAFSPADALVLTVSALVAAAVALY